MTTWVANPVKMNYTRFDGLGFIQQAPGLWRFIDLESGCTIGEYYTRKDELLADLTRYATTYGFSVKVTK